MHMIGYWRHTYVVTDFLIKTSTSTGKETRKRKHNFISSKREYGMQKEQTDQ